MSKKNAIATTCMVFTMFAASTALSKKEEIALCHDTKTGNKFHITKNGDGKKLHSHSNDHGKRIVYEIDEFVAGANGVGVFVFEVDEHFIPDAQKIRVEGTGSTHTIKTYDRKGKLLHKQDAKCTVNGSAKKADAELVGYAADFGKRRPKVADLKIK